jgi:hypothetical protein
MLLNFLKGRNFGHWFKDLDQKNLNSRLEYFEMEFQNLI